VASRLSNAVDAGETEGHRLSLRWAAAEVVENLTQRCRMYTER